MVRKASAAMCALLLGGAIAHAQPENRPGIFIMGVDGVDPVILSRMIDEGKLPNFAKLAREGSYQELGTSNPPQSPVAWSNFVTGMNPGGHGIFDFVHRDPKELEPYLSTSRTEEPDYVLEVPEEDLAEIGLSAVEQAVDFAIVTIPADSRRMTANLQGPVVVNKSTRVGRQCISSNPKWKVRHVILEELAAVES